MISVKTDEGFKPVCKTVEAGNTGFSSVMMLPASNVKKVLGDDLRLMSGNIRFRCDEGSTRYEFDAFVVAFDKHTVEFQLTGSSERSGAL